MTRKMKDSGIEWIGMIPEGWKLVPLHRVVNYNSNTLSEDTADDFEFDYVDIGSVAYGKGIQFFQRMLFKNAPSRARRVVQTNDIIISTVRTYLKACAQIPKHELPIIVSTGFLVLTTKSCLDESFLKYSILSDSFVSGVEAYSIGISYPAINAMDAVKMKISVPPLPEQHRIAAYLDATCAQIDEVLEKTRASIEEYKKLKQAVITQAVTKGIRPGRKMKDSGIEWIGEIPEEWVCTILKRCCSFQTGSTPSTTNTQWFDGEFDWFTPTDFNEQFYLKNSSRKLSMLAKIDGVATIIPSNTVMIIGIGGTAGKIGFTLYECSCNQQITAILANQMLLPKFLMYWMIANSKIIKENALFTTLPIINNQTIGQYILIFPSSIIEQKGIAAYLDAKCAEIDTLIAKKQQLLAELESYKKSLIFEYVTGKKEVLG